MQTEYLAEKVEQSSILSNDTVYCYSHCSAVIGFAQRVARKVALCNDPVALLRMRETYELRMKIHKLIIIRTKFP